MNAEEAARITPEGCCYTNGTSSKMKKVAIIGAGPAGLCAAKHFFAPGSGFTGYVFEQAGDIGGTWLYSDVTGKDRFGLPIHSTLYYDLWTNLPKESMTYPGFEFDGEERSYLPATRVLQYLVDYADKFQLHQYIKIHHLVSRVAPVGDSWSVTALELTTQEEHVSRFDAVIICSGPNIIPVYPTVEGLARFSGRQIHSKEYRKASAFEGKRVLIIGLGPSGIDISFYLLPLAKKVIISHNKPSLFGLTFPKDISIKPVVSSMEDKTVYFSDGTQEEVDVIIHCTGYTYHYPFLTPECGLIVDQYINPLYRHFINIEHPTMCLIGVPKKCPLHYMVDYQVRAFKNILNGVATLPSQEEMLAETENELTKRSAEGQRKKDYHKMTPARNEVYFKQLAELGGLDPIPPVVLKVFADAFTTAIKDFINFRNTVYKILDNENYSKISRKTSSVSVKFAEGQCRFIQESEAVKNELQIKEETTSTREESKGSEENEKSTVDETEETAEVAEDGSEIKLENTVEEVELNDCAESELEEKVTSMLITKSNEQSMITESVTVITNHETFEVEAVVEKVPSGTNYENYEVDQTSSEDEENNKNAKNLAMTVSVSHEENRTKSSGGDEIVKIIQAEEASGFR